MAGLANLAKAPVAIAKLASNAAAARGVKAKFLQHVYSKGPQDQLEEEYHRWYTSWMETEKKIYVDSDLDIPRKDFTKFVEHMEDADLTGFASMFAFMGGGVPALLASPIWASSVQYLPSTFFGDEKSLREWGTVKDQEVHIKYAPTTAYLHGKTLEHWAAMDPKYNEAFDSISDGFRGKKDAKAIRKFAQYVGKVGTCSQHLVRADVGGWFRSNDHQYTSCFLGLPYTFYSVKALSGRLVEKYRALYQEDKLIQKEGLNALSDFELYRICNRRLVARWEEDLNRQQLEARYGDWATFTEVKAGSDYVPIRAVVLYQTSFFRDPGFLDERIETLDEDVWPEHFSWAKDCFERRIDFEQGALRHQVQAHLEAQEAAKKISA